MTTSKLDQVLMFIYKSVANQHTIIKKFVTL